jgi:dihydrofolate reductase
MPKFVASTTLKEPLEWNATLLQGDVIAAVRELTEQPGQGLLIYGSGALADTLTQHGLIDVYRLMIYPVALGSGERCFRDGGGMSTLKLSGATTTATGVVVLTYEPAEAVAA